MTLALQLDMFTVPPPVLGGTVQSRVRRPMRLAPDVAHCPECGHGCFSFVMEQGEEIHEVAAYCSCCGHLVAHTPRLRSHAVSLLDLYGDAACCRGPTPPSPLPEDRPPWACAWNGKPQGCECRRAHTEAA